MAIKQIIVMRTDLNMRKGKMVAQGSHASMMFLSETIRNSLSPDFNEIAGKPTRPLVLSDEEIEWIKGSFTKICVSVDSEEELDRIYKEACDNGLNAYVVIDSGKTEFNGIPTKTCLAIGPDNSEDIDKITGKLKLL